jgi:hypothetical protein
MNKLLLSTLALAAVGFAGADLDKSQVAGTWLLNGSDRSTKFVFGKDGRFSFVGLNATSKGKWKVEGAKIHLVWTEIDKERVAPDSVKGSFPLTAEGGFRVNNYVYRKA